MITRKSRAEIEKMRRAGRVVAEVLALVESALKPGVATIELDRIAEAHMRAEGAVPSFKGYLGGRRYGRGPHAFPASICVSIDNEIVHGIPNGRQIEDGQLVSIDVGAIVDGWHGDGARTFVVGSVKRELIDLVEATRMGMMAGIAAATVGHRIGDISAAVEAVAKPRGYGVVRQFVGHGIGTDMHEDPQVPNFGTRSGGPELAPGVCLAIEPMFTLGTGDAEILDDGWTVVTADGSLAAHFEHTIAITENGPEILTTI
jgi:methionyl aminopeptidase